MSTLVTEIEMVHVVHYDTPKFIEELAKFKEGTPQEQVDFALKYLPLLASQLPGHSGIAVNQVNIASTPEAVIMEHDSQTYGKYAISYEVVLE